MKEQIEVQVLEIIRNFHEVVPDLEFEFSGFEEHANTKTSV